MSATFAALAAVVVLAAGDVRATATEFNGIYYKVVASSACWHCARRQCETMGGRLAVAPNAEAAAFLAELADGRVLWLGASEEDQPGMWRWVDGAEMTWNRWAPGYAADDEGRAHCLALDAAGLWRGVHSGGCATGGAVDGADVAGFICEWPKEGAAARPPPLPTPVRPQSPPSAAARFRGHWYEVVTDKVSWHMAVQRCQARGGYLCRVEDTEESAFVASIALGRRLWLGATDEAEEGAWRWASGEKAAFARWAWGEPNNHERREHYMHTSPGGEWNDTNCGGYWNARESVAGYIIEWDRLEPGGPDALCSRCKNTFPGEYKYCPFCAIPIYPRHDNFSLDPEGQVMPDIEQ